MARLPERRCPPSELFEDCQTGRIVVGQNPNLLALLVVASYVARLVVPKADRANGLYATLAMTLRCPALVVGRSLWLGASPTRVHRFWRMAMRLLLLLDLTPMSGFFGHSFVFRAIHRSKSRFECIQKRSGSAPRPKSTDRSTKLPPQFPATAFWIGSYEAWSMSLAILRCSRNVGRVALAKVFRPELSPPFA